MTDTYVSVQLQVNGQPFTFAVDCTDDTEKEVVNLVSGLGIGDTFSGGATITYVSCPILEAGSGSILGMVLTDPQNNVVMQIPLVDAELQSPGGYPVSCPVGLNFTLNCTTKNAPA
jgi:hypothetical protein